MFSSDVTKKEYYSEEAMRADESAYVKMMHEEADKKAEEDKMDSEISRINEQLSDLRKERNEAVTNIKEEAKLEIDEVIRTKNAEISELLDKRDELLTKKARAEEVCCKDKCLSDIYELSDSDIKEIGKMISEAFDLFCY